MQLGRLLALAVVFVVSFSAVAWIRSRSVGNQETSVLSMDKAIPSRMGDWQGEDQSIEDETIRVMNAYSFVNRVYRNSSGDVVSMHGANWLNLEGMHPTPHHPEVCYPGAGWTIVDRRTVECVAQSGRFPMELILFEKNRQRVVTAHWFRVGEINFVSEDGFQRERYRFWGSAAWPSTNKFLLQTSASSLNAAEQLLIGFAAELQNTLHSSST